MEGLIPYLSSFAGGSPPGARLAVCRHGNHQLAELQMADGLLPYLLLKGDARLHSKQKVRQSTVSHPAVSALLQLCFRFFKFGSYWF